MGLSITKRFALMIACLGVGTLFAQNDAGYLMLVEQGRQALDSAQPATAVRLLKQGFEEMNAAGEPGERMLPVLIALSTACLDSGDISQAERTLLTAAPMAEALHSAMFSAELANNWANVHMRLGKYAEAKTELKKTIEQLRQDPDAWKLLPNLLDSLATAEILLGSYGDGFLHQQAAIDGWKKFLPATHSNLIKAYTGLATAQYFLGCYEEARTSMEIAISAAEVIYGKQNPSFARLLRNEIIVLNKLGRKKESRAREKELASITVDEKPATNAFTRGAVVGQ